MQQRNIRVTIEIAIFTALAMVLDQFVLFRMPQGGSISLAMLPIIVIALRRGTIVGFTTGFLMGLLNFMFGGFFVNIIQMLLDYPLSFAVIGFAGVFSKPFQAYITADHRSKAATYASLGTIVSGISALVPHTIAGVVFYASFAPKNESVFLYSLIYNATFLIPQTLITLVIIVLLVLKAPRIFTDNL